MTTKPPPGIYRIVVAGNSEPALLTRLGEERVTILAPGTEPDPQQEWRIVPGKDGNIIIERPSKIIPTSYLTYKGAPEEPERGRRVEYRLSESPRNEWHAAIVPNLRSFIRVAGSELGIAVAPPFIHPPFLKLVPENQLEWVFERVRDE